MPDKHHTNTAATSEQTPPEQYEATVRAKRKAIEVKLRGAPNIELSNVARWKRYKVANRCGLGKALMNHAERWARLMQVELADGKSLEDVARDTFHEADLEGVAGASGGFTLRVLVECWKHGERLHQWHVRTSGPKNGRGS